MCECSRKTKLGILHMGWIIFKRLTLHRHYFVSRWIGDGGPECTCRWWRNGLHECLSLRILYRKKPLKRFALQKAAFPACSKKTLQHLSSTPTNPRMCRDLCPSSPYLWCRHYRRLCITSTLISSPFSNLFFNPRIPSFGAFSLLSSLKPLFESFAFGPDKDGVKKVYARWNLLAHTHRKVL